MNKKTIKKDLDQIAVKDQHVAKALAEHGYPEPRPREVGFEAFLTTIVSQQISTQAAKTIIERVFVAIGDVTPEAVLVTPSETLRGAGLSQRKLDYARGLAEAILAGTFRVDDLPKMSDEEAIDHIVQLKGFGVWSAEIYLLFSLGRRDIFPADDLIIRTSLYKLKRKRKTLTAKSARDAVKSWSPQKSAGSLFLWHLHHCGFTKRSGIKL